MQSTPQRISLIAQTRTVLLEGMRQRRWQHELPGERLLSRELRISRWTLRAALAELARDGYLRIAQGMPCTILPRALRTKERVPPARRVALLAPAPLSKLRQFVSLWVDELRILLNEQGIQLSVHDAPKAYRANPVHALENLLEKHPHHDWLILLSTRAMQEWFQARREFVLIAGSRFEGIHLPAIDIASYAAGVHAAHTLLGLGHRQIAIVIPPVANAGVLATEAGLRHAVGKAPHAARVDTIICTEEPADVCRMVDRVLAGPNPPTVLIGAKGAVVLTGFSHLMRLKLRVPQDISLLSIEWEPYLDLVVPRIAHYELAPALLARHIARGFLRPAAGSVSPTYLTPQFVPGASLRRLTV
ncbi:MAG: LacI family DNA-binding transcriptional regulator [Opitutaceae bacterium]|nr:LacI family DNA-binding transcriptional regulator [Opitutaceae bacterium]